MPPKQTTEPVQPAADNTPADVTESNTPAAQPAAPATRQMPAESTVHEVHFGPTAQPTDAPPAEKGESGKAEPKLFTQEEVNKLVGQTRREVRDQFKDYDDLKSKVQEQEEAQRSEDEKRAQRLQELEERERTLAEENRTLKINQSIMGAAVEIGLPPEATVKLIDMQAAEFDDKGAITNVDVLVKAVAEKWPGLVKAAVPAARAGATSNPGREQQPVGRTDEDRRRDYFGGGGGAIWQSGGVRTPRNNN